ncbi:MAG: efflux RND transporter permease subunit, partial [Planctomycetota bacterium]
EPTEELTVTADPDELAALGLSPARVADAIAQADAKRPAGTVRSSGGDRDLEVAGALDAAARVAAVPLPLSSQFASQNQTAVRVGDVATVRRGIQTPADSIALTDGRRAVFVAARVGSGQRTDLWAERAKAEVNVFAEGVGAAARVGLVYDESVYTNARLAELAGNLFAGSALIAAVIFFMMGWRASLVVCSALPLVCGGTLFAILALGGSLHQMSIFGFIIALGLLIDNAIVVTDEVRVQLRTGKSRFDAVKAATNHLLIPLAASTLTTVLAFAPIVLLNGNIGDFVGPIGVSVVLAVAGSFLVAVMLVAALAAKYLPTGTERRGGLRGTLSRGIESPALTRIYTSVIRVGARRPGLALLASLTLPLCGVAAATGMGRQFFPRVDRNMFDVQIWMPAGTGIAATTEAAREVERLLRDAPGAAQQPDGDEGESPVQHVHWLAGASLPSVYYNLVENSDGQADYARGVVVADSFEDVKALLAKAQPRLDDAFPDAQIVLSQFAQGPPVDSPVMIRLFGPDVAMLQTLGDEV